MKVITTILFVIVANLSFAQEYDTIYHTLSKPTEFKFLLADTYLTSYKVSKIDIKTIEGDTIEKTIKTDTFFVRKINNVDQFSYEYWLSERNWLNTILGSECTEFYHKVNQIPKFKIKWNDKSKSFQIDNCEENISIIQESLSICIDCIKQSDDQYMLKYVLEDVENIKDCSKQTLMMMQDLGHIASYINFPIPDQDSLIRFSIIDKSDTTGLLNIHFKCEKETDNNTTIIKLSEDLTQSDAASSKIHSGLYNVFKDMLSPEEQKRDSIRLSSKEDYELTTMTVDSNMIFKDYRRHSYYSMLNIDLKMKKSEYFYIIERIND